MKALFNAAEPFLGIFDEEVGWAFSAENGEKTSGALAPHIFLWIPIASVSHEDARSTPPFALCMLPVDRKQNAQRLLRY